MSSQIIRAGVLNTSKITGLSVPELIGEMQELAGIYLPKKLSPAIEEIQKKYPGKAINFVATAMFPFLITSDNPAPDRLKTLSQYDSTPGQIFKEVGSLNWSRDVETAAIGMKLGTGIGPKKKTKRKGMPIKLLNKSRRWIKTVLRKLRKSKGKIKVTRKEVAVFANNQSLQNAMRFAAQKRRVPRQKINTMINYVARRFAKLAKVIGNSNAMKALKATFALLKQAKQSGSQGFKQPGIGRYENRVESKVGGTGRPGMRLSYFLTKWVGIPAAIIVGVSMMWQIVPTWTVAALGGIGLAIFLTALNKYSKRNKKKGRKFMGG